MKGYLLTHFEIETEQEKLLALFAYLAEYYGITDREERRYNADSIRKLNSKNSFTKRHCHLYPEIRYVISGCVKYTLCLEHTEKEIYVGKFDFVFIPALLSHSTEVVSEELVLIAFFNNNRNPLTTKERENEVYLEKLGYNKPEREKLKKVDKYESVFPIISVKPVDFFATEFVESFNSFRLKRMVKNVLNKYIIRWL